jgi:hypothetical protein
MGILRQSSPETTTRDGSESNSPLIPNRDAADHAYRYNLHEVVDTIILFSRALSARE